MYGAGNELVLTLLFVALFYLLSVVFSLVFGYSGLLQNA